jgi:CO dehydrogenase maturation factor
MRLAIAGKGGAGKTTLSATLARLAARTGQPVVAIDADANPNLAAALGLSPELAATQTSVPPSLVSRKRGGTGLLRPIAEILDQHTLTGPDGVRLLGMGAPAHAEQGCLCSAHAVVSSMLEDLGEPDPDGNERLVIIDMEASPEHLSRGTIRHVDAVLFVAEPYYRNLETVRRMNNLVAELPVPHVTVVANKIRTPADLTAITEFCDRHHLHLSGDVPYSDTVINADRNRTPLIDTPDGQPVVTAIDKLRISLQELR